MNRIASLTLFAILLAAALAAGYWWGSRAPFDAPREPGTRAASGTAAAKPGGERKVLYYRNPMGLPDVSPVPKKDPMGMDYLPVYEGDEPQDATSHVKVSNERIQRLGVRLEEVAVRELISTIRAVGTLQVDERRLAVVAPRFEGWIERLHVNTTGQAVGHGQALMEVYSPDLVAAQEEYLIAWRGVAAMRDSSTEAQAAMQRLVAGALARLRNWEISDRELARLQQEGRPRQTLPLRAPAAGVVMEKAAVAGMRFMPGEPLYRIANLSALWLLADVFEQDLAQVRTGLPARITVAAYPERVFEGRVAFVYPTVARETRTAKVRVELPNPGGLLKPEMYANVELAASRGGARGLAVPDSAVIDSGTRRVVLVERAEGMFEPRSVRLGARADGYVEVLEGVTAGEKVVVSANFLIDSESNLKAALASFTAPAYGTAAGRTPAVHSATGTVRAVDLSNALLEIHHEPVASLKWPAMTMEFQVADRALLQAVKPGAVVSFDFAERAPGEYVVSRIAQHAPPAPDPAGNAAVHKGH